MFVVCITSSTDKEIKGVKDGIQSDSQVGLLAFGDRFSGEESKILQFWEYIFTPDTIYFSQQVATLTIEKK
ncbi:MAG: hypothetical protein QNJ64_19240 [Crocosphaera sp.]|nr:hypothetical protein [Crocosphaera sp.]